MGETKTDPRLEEVSKAVNRRKTALIKLKKGEKPGTISERRLRKLLKQVQRRKRKILVDQARRQKKGATEGAAAPK
jgi:hypothetical protein